MKDLAALQRAFQRHVYRPGRAMAQLVHARNGTDAQRRLDVYAQGYAVRLIEALGSDYPALRSLLGENDYQRLMRGFIAAHPSRHANLRWYGGDLAGFLRRAPTWRRRPLLAQLARFEWALGLAFDAADATPATPDAVARLSAEQWPRLCLTLHPSAQIVRLRSNAPDIWREAIAGRKPPPPINRPRASAWLVWRQELEPFYRSLPPAEAWALGAVARGHDFAYLLSGLRRFVGTPQAAQAGAQFLRNWFSEGLISRVDAKA